MAKYRYSGQRKPAIESRLGTGASASGEATQYTSFYLDVYEELESGATRYHRVTIDREEAEHLIKSLRASLDAKVNRYGIIA